jgi:O-antigen/teichoic acid export membrane protein
MPELNELTMPARETATSARGTRLARRLFSNYVFQTMNWGVRLVEQLVLIPLYIYAWGPIYYKDWIVLYALVAFLCWCTLGTDEYFGNLFLRDVSVGDFAALKRRMKIGLFTALCVTGLIFALLYGALFVGDLRRLLGLSLMDEGTALFCLIAMTLPMSVWYCAAVLRGSYRAYGDFSRGECIFGIYNVTQIGSVALALALRAPPKMVALLYMAMPILYAIGLLIDIRRRYPEVPLALAVPSRAEWRHIVPQSLYYFTSPLSIALNQNGVLLMFGFLGIGALETVKFNVLRIFTGLTRQIGAQSFSIGSGIEMARQHAQGDHEGCRRLYADTGRIVSCLGAILAGVSIPLSGPFVALWTRGTVAADMPLILCFLAGILLSGPGRASLMLLRYTNNATAVAWSSSLYAFAGLALAVPLARVFDSFGVALAFAITETAAIGLYPPLLVSRLFGFGAARHLAASYLAGALAFALSFGVASALFGGAASPVALALRLLVWAAIVLPLGLLLILPREQLRRLAAPLGRLRPS